MLMNETPVPPEEGMSPLLAAAELQDHLMTVTHDLERLQRLLDDAGEALSTHFYSASNHVSGLLRSADGLPEANTVCIHAVLSLPPTASSRGGSRPSSPRSA